MTFVTIIGLIRMDVQQSSTNSASVNLMNGYPVLCSTEYGSTDSSPAGEHGLCADDAENAGEVSVNQEVANAADAPVSSVRASSPDLNCPICLGRLENRSYTDTCFHKFCFVCLVEWSKVKPVCPLCKQPFTSVIHNVQSYENFEQLPITPGSGGTAAAADSNRSRFRYPTTVIGGSSERRRQRESLRRPSRLRRRGSSRFDVPPPAFTSSFRRSIYRDGLWVRSVADSGRCRDTSAEFFARNPTAVHRLMPWLNRELMALLRNPADVAFLLEVILSTVLRVDITSETFHDLVAPFLGARTRHFVHEFHTFARSPFNMEAYDTRVVYERPSQIASTTPIEFSDTSSGDSSDAEIVEINPLVSAGESNLAVNDDGHAVNEGVFGLGQSVADIDRNVSSPQPGPSHLHDIPLPKPSHVSHVESIPVPSSSLHPISSSSDGQNITRNMDNSDEGSDDDVEVIAQDKPWTDRSPVVLSSSDTDADNEVELLHQTTNSSTTVNSQISANTSQEVLSTIQDNIIDTGSSEHHETGLVHSDVQENRDETTTIGSSQASQTSSCQSKHRHKRANRHKRSHHRDSGHLDSESCSGSPHKKHRHQSRKMKFRDEIVIDDELNNEASSSTSYAETVSDSYRVGNRVWLSDTDSDSDDHQSLRSVIVVPQKFKKNSSGHKRSTRDST